MPEATDPKYSVFVSYRRLPEDTRWAEWLVETLGNFDTPEPLRKKGVPERVGLIFRDDNEMSGADLRRPQSRPMELL